MIFITEKLYVRGSKVDNEIWFYTQKTYNKKLHSTYTELLPQLFLFKFNINSMPSICYAGQPESYIFRGT